MCAAPSPKRQRRTVFWPDMEKQHRRSPSPHLRQVLRCGGDREAKHTQIVYIMPRPRHLSRATPALRHPRPTWDAAPASRPEGEETAFHRVHKPRPLLAIIVAAFHCGCQRSFTSSGRLPHRRRENEWGSVIQGPPQRLVVSRGPLFFLPSARERGRRTSSLSHHPPP